MYWCCCVCFFHKATWKMVAELWTETRRKNHFQFTHDFPSVCEITFALVNLIKSNTTDEVFHLQSVGAAIVQRELCVSFRSLPSRVLRAVLHHSADSPWADTCGPFVMTPFSQTRFLPVPFPMPLLTEPENSTTAPNHWRFTVSAVCWEDYVFQTRDEIKVQRGRRDMPYGRLQCPQLHETFTTAETQMSQIKSNVNHYG